MSKLPRANKELGQHFLRDQKIIQGITQDHADQCDVIVEVGPGPAILTESLSQHDKPFYVIEMDTRFQEYLEKWVETDNIFFEDALKFKWDKFILANELQNKKIWLVSNLPYNVSAPLFISFLQVPQIQYMSLMFQKEVGEKTYQHPTRKNQMNSLLALGQNYFDSKLLLKVHPGAFNPPPKVESIVVSYQRKSAPEITLADFRKYESFLRTLFQFKRKQLGSVLKGLLGQNKERFFEDLPIPATARAESLTMGEIYLLYNKIQAL
jgi:16S rRNA (adenine1518-N6/adenine1519-N6)-dimethyltransferase